MSKEIDEGVTDEEAERTVTGLSRNLDRTVAKGESAATVSTPR